MLTALLTLILGILRIIAFTGVFLWFLGAFFGLICEFFEKISEIINFETEKKAVLLSKTILKYALFILLVLIAVGFTGFVAYYVITHPEETFRPPDSSEYWAFISEGF